MAGVLQTLTIDQLTAYSRNKANELQSMDWTRPLKVANLLLAAGIRRNFDESHAPDGTPWLPLKRRQGRPLRDNGLLMASATARARKTLTSTELILECVLDYAAIHQYGGTVTIPELVRKPDQGPFVFQGRDGNTIFSRRIREHKVTIPARPFMGISAETSDLIAQAFAEHMDGTL